MERGPGPAAGAAEGRPEAGVRGPAAGLRALPRPWALLPKQLLAPCFPPCFRLARVRSGPQHALLRLPNPVQMGCLKHFRWSFGLMPAANQSLNSGE